MLPQRVIQLPHNPTAVPLFEPLEEVRGALVPRVPAVAPGLPVRRSQLGMQPHPVCGDGPGHRPTFSSDLPGRTAENGGRTGDALDQPAGRGPAPVVLEAVHDLVRQHAVELVPRAGLRVDEVLEREVDLLRCGPPVRSADGGTRGWIAIRAGYLVRRRAEGVRDAARHGAQDEPDLRDAARWLGSTFAATLAMDPD